MQLTKPPPVLSKVVTCNCVRPLGAGTRNRTQGLQKKWSAFVLYKTHVLRTLDTNRVHCHCQIKLIVRQSHITLAALVTHWHFQLEGAVSKFQCPSQLLACMRLRSTSLCTAIESLISTA